MLQHKRKPEPTSWEAIKTVDLARDVVRPVMFTDTNVSRQAAREQMARSATSLARRDMDHVIDEYVEQAGLAGGEAA